MREVCVCVFVCVLARETETVYTYIFILSLTPCFKGSSFKVYSPVPCWGMQTHLDGTESGGASKLQRQRLE